MNKNNEQFSVESLAQVEADKSKKAREINGFHEEHLKRVEQLVYDYKDNIKLHLQEQQSQKDTWSDRLADKIASFGGSWPFIIIFSVFLFLWLIWNLLSFTTHFDEHPFVLLNLILSFIASFQAPIILMSQNRQSERDKQEAMIDFAINFKAEQENLEMQLQLKRIEQLLMELKSDSTGKT